MVSKMSRRRPERAVRKRRSTNVSESPSSGSESAAENADGDVYHHENSPNAEEGNDVDDFEEPETHQMQRPRKKPRNGPSAPADVAEIENFEENHLFTALSLPGVAVLDLALEWLDSFEEDEANNTSLAITGLFNLVLRACGCTHLAQAHDMINEDSAPATVAEIAIIFSRQLLHEYPFAGTNKSARHFRQNMQEFFRNIVSVGHEKGSLYKEGGTDDASSLGAPMMNCVLAWLLALSECNVRPLRFVALCVLLDMQTQLCDLASSVTISLQKQQRQLNNARNSTTSRNQRVQKSKIAIIQESVDTFTVQRDTVLEYIGDIFQHVFVNRYRDIDPAARAECVKALAQWMVKYEEMFLRADYLRYLGWLLSDPAETVRLEVTKLLHRLYRFVNGKREAMSIGFRQFTERFKDQFISMVWKEKTTGIKTHLLDVLTELFSLGFLEDSDVTEVCLFGFFLADHELTSKGDTKAKIEVCKFMVVVCEEHSGLEIEPFTDFLVTHESGHFDTSENSLTVLQCLKFKLLAELMERSLSHYEGIRKSLNITNDQRKPSFMLIDLLFRIMYSTPKFQGQWEGLIKYTLCDFSSITFRRNDKTSDPADEATNNRLVSKLEINNLAEKRVFISFIAAAIIYILTKEPPKKAHASATVDDLNSALPALVRYIPDLEEYLRKGLNLYAVFMSIWNSILITVPTSITRLYSTVADVSDYNAIHEKVLHYYFDLTSPEDELTEAFDTYFSLILKNYEGSNSTDFASKSDRLLNPTIKMKIDELLHSLATEGVEILMLDEAIEDAIDSEENNSLKPEQKTAVNRLLRVTPVLEKFSQIARVINTNKYVAEPALGTSNVLLEVLEVKLVSLFDFEELTRVWRSHYAKLMDQVKNSWQIVLEFVLLSLSWKLEDLTYASNDNSAQHIDLSLFLDDFNGLLVSIGRHCVSVGHSAREINEIVSESNPQMSLLVQNFVALHHKFARYYIDMLVSLRTFYDKFKGEENFRNFTSFFENEAGVGKFVKGELPSDIQDSLKRVFLIHESRLAMVKHNSLERQSDEDVNYDDFIFEDDCLPGMLNGEGIDPGQNGNAQGEVQSAEPSAHRDNNALDDGRVWAAEKELCVYTLKLFSLIRTNAFSSATAERFQLNSKTLGGVFEKVVEAGNAQSVVHEEQLLNTEEISATSD